MYGRPGVSLLFQFEFVGWVCVCCVCVCVCMCVCEFKTPVCLQAVLNMACCCLFLFASFIQSLVFGQLQLVEQQVNDSFL